MYLECVYPDAHTVKFEGDSNAFKVYFVQN